ncbi:MAG: hypothetical protein P8R48_10240 [Planctomycetota bacterium]|nr:hypothetical protein [Planctomycetota bacterium]
MEKPTQVQHGEDLDGALTKLHGSALGVLWARSLGAHLPLALLIAGTLVLVMRFMGDLGRQEAAYALLLVVLAPVTAWLVARGRVPARADLVAWLDRRSGGTGRILTHFAVGDERWSAMAASDCRRESSTAKPLAPDYSPAAWRSLPAGLFACAALWVSPVSAAAGPPVALFENMLNGLVERLADLEELGLMDDERVEELAERLKEITGGLDEGNLEQALESMERFSEQMDEESGRLADMLAAAREAMESVSPEDQEALAEAFQRMAESFAGSPLAAEAMANAEKLMEGLEGMDMSGLEGLEGLEGLDLSDLSGVQGAMSAELAAKLSEMAQAGFLNQNALAKALARRGKPGNLDKFDFAHADDCESKKGGL